MCVLFVEVHKVHIKNAVCEMLRNINIPEIQKHRTTKKKIMNGREKNNKIGWEFEEKRMRIEENSTLYVCMCCYLTFGFFLISETLWQDK